MTLFITGGSGFIGSAVIRKALARGISVVNIDCLTYAANPDNLTPALPDENYNFEEVDIRDRQAVKELFSRYKPTSLMHLAAESHVDRSIDKPATFIETNIVGTFNLLAAATDYYHRQSEGIKAGFRFHHISTDEVFGDLGPNDPAFHETTPYDPSSPYSASKAASDHLVRAWGRTYHLPFLVTNCSNNYGPYQFPEKLIPVVILKCLSGQSIPVYGTGENIRDWLYVEDHADALFAVLEKGRVGETYNIGGENERQNIDVVKTICAIMDRLRPRSNGLLYEQLIEFVPDRPGHDRRYGIDARKIRNELGWSPSVKFDEGFEKTVVWYVENTEWWQPVSKRNRLGDRMGLGPKE